MSTNPPFGQPPQQPGFSQQPTPRPFTQQPPTQSGFPQQAGQQPVQQPVQQYQQQVPVQGQPHGQATSGWSNPGQPGAVQQPATQPQAGFAQQPGFPQQPVAVPQGGPQQQGGAQQGGHPQQAFQQQGFQQPGAPSGYPAPPRARGARKSGKAPTIVVTALITGIVSVTATLLATGTLTAPPTFDEDALTEGVAEVLSTSFDLTDVEDVSCPSAVKVVEGAEFECTFTSGGEDLSIPVTVLNDEGQYRVGGPAPS